MKLMKTGIVLLGAMIGLVLSGCPNNSEDDPNNEASITALTVAGAALTKLPTPISSKDWSDTPLTELSAEYAGELFLPSVAALTDAAVQVTASSGSMVTFNKAAGATKPEEFPNANGGKLTFTESQFLIIKVVSEDKKLIQYYRIQIQAMKNNAALTEIKVADKVATLGTPNAVYTAAVAGNADLTDALLANAEITITKGDKNAAVKYAKAAGTAAPVFGDTAKFTFANGDFLYIEVTASDGTTKLIYKIKIRTGTIATLSKLVVDDQTVTLGDAYLTVGAAQAGAPANVLFTRNQPATGFKATATVTETGAAVKYAKVTGTGAPAGFAATDTYIFAEGDFLYIEVTSRGSEVKNYYKIKVSLKQAASIKYGRPAIVNDTIDPIWNTVTETYNINRVYAADSTETFKANPNTSGVAKALWDEEGLYVFVTVTDPIVTEGGTYQDDSVELFINENFAQTAGSYTAGGQYRVGAVGQISGDPTAASNAVDPGKVSAWKTVTGYIVIFQAPWRFTAANPLGNNKKIGFELQINASSAAGSRDGVLAWNNNASSNYQNVSQYGEAVLTGAPTPLKVHAKRPAISVQPAGAISPLNVTVTPLTVTAASPDGGTLSYQWYSNTKNSAAGGTVIAGAIGASYTPPNGTVAGSKYYYVVVTNTNNSATGDKIAKTASSVAEITFMAGEVVEKIVGSNGSYPIYKFVLPVGGKWSDYTKVTVEFMVSAATFRDITDARARLMGNYQATDFSVNGDFRIAQGNSFNAAYIMNNEKGSGAALSALGATAGGTWFSMSFALSGAGHADFNKAPDAAATGPFYMGIGLTRNGEDKAITFYARKVTLSNADGTKKVTSTGAGLDKPAFFGNTPTMSRVFVTAMAAENLN